MRAVVYIRSKNDYVLPIIVILFLLSEKGQYAREIKEFLEPWNCRKCWSLSDGEVGVPHATPALPIGIMWDIVSFFLVRYPFDCGDTNFFGEFLYSNASLNPSGSSSLPWEGIVWYPFRGSKNSLQELSLAVRPKKKMAPSKYNNMLTRNTN